MENGGDADPVFVVFCPRSGTTWLRMLLNGHRRVSCGPEFSLFCDRVGVGGQIRAFHDPRSHIGLRTALSQAHYYSRLRQHFNLIYADSVAEHKPGARIVVDKSSSNAVALDLISAIYPGCKTIVLLRNPADTVRSLVRASGSWNPDFPNTAHIAFAFWEAHMSKILLHIGDFAAVHWIHYEDIEASPQAEVQACFRFLNAPALSAETVDGICEAASLSNLKKRRWHGGGFFGNRTDPSLTVAPELSGVELPQSTRQLYEALCALSGKCPQPDAKN